MVSFSNDASSVCSEETAVVNNTRSVKQNKMIVMKRMAAILGGFAVVGVLFAHSTSTGGSSVPMRESASSWQQHALQGGKPLWAAHEQEMESSRRHLSTPYDQTENIILPAYTDRLVNVWEPMGPNEVPMFWSIPKAGGATVVKIFSYCLGLVLASNKGINTGITTPTVFQVGTSSPYPYFANYVNVKTHNNNWIRRCHNRGLLQSGLADVVSVQNMTYAMEQLFLAPYYARGFTMMRHPVKRAVDLFYYRQHATWEKTYDQDLAALSLESYASSDKMVENLMVRMLVQLRGLSEEVGESHVTLAKEILRRKFLVTIFEWFDVGMIRIEKYFQWFDSKNVLTDLDVNNCHYIHIEAGDRVGFYPKIPDTEQIYSIIMTRNWADVELYQYAKTLFAEQAKLI